MSQAKGALTQLLMQRQSTFRDPPSPAAAFKLPFTKWNSGRDPQKVDDPSISASPLPGKKGCGNPVFSPTLESILDLRSIGHLLALLLGVPTAQAAVTKQPTNVTGVTVNYAESGTTAGNGTLSFTAAGTTLDWKAQGDATAGTAVDVSAGGYFTLQSGTAAHSVHVTVAASALPVTDKSDADINVSATLKTHAFPITLTDRPSALFEAGFTDIGKYYRLLGTKLNTLGYDIGAKEQSISCGLIGAVESTEAAAFDAAPTSYQSVRACGGGGALWNGVDASLGSLTGGKIDISNQMNGRLTVKDDRAAIAANTGYGLITQEDLLIKGTVQAAFDGAGAYALALAGTSSRLRIGSRAAVGSDVFSLVWDIPNVEFVEKSIPIEGKSGIFADLEWMAHRDTAGTLPLVTLTNDVAAY